MLKSNDRETDSFTTLESFPWHECHDEMYCEDEVVKMKVERVGCQYGGPPWWCGHADILGRTVASASSLDKYDCQQRLEQDVRAFLRHCADAHARFGKPQ